MKKCISLGTFPFAGPFSKVDESVASKIVNRFLEKGGRRIDTAPTYGFGKVEELLGKILSTHKRDEFEIVSCCGYVKSGDGYVISGRSDDIYKDIDESLERLKLSDIDIYYSHIPDPNTPLSETSETLNELKKGGKIKYVGVSNVNIKQLVEYQKGGTIDFVQNRFSYLNRAISKDFRDFTEYHNISISTYQVIERGLLTDRGPSITHENDLRLRKPEFKTEVTKIIRNLIIQHLKPICDQYNYSIKKAVILWTLNTPGITAVQVGATKVSDIDDLPFDETPKSGFMKDMEDAFDKIIIGTAQNGFPTLSRLMGLDTYDIKSGSASGK